jgi:hypothetical protein
LVLTFSGLWSHIEREPTLKRHKTVSASIRYCRLTRQSHLLRVRRSLKSATAHPFRDQDDRPLDHSLSNLSENRSRLADRHPFSVCPISE